MSWYRKSPDGFKYSIKAPKLITHTKKFIECEKELIEFYAACETGLKDKLACVLFQLPPSFQYSPERLELITASVDIRFSNAIEFRHASWWTEAVFQTLRQHKMIFLQCELSRSAHRYHRYDADSLLATPRQPAPVLLRIQRCIFAARDAPPRHTQPE